MPDPCARGCVIAAPGSGQGKTWVTAALARACVRSGRRVRVMKVGPDFIDPEILARASGSPVCTLDPWMAGDDACARELGEAGRSADVVLVEGVMGLFDGSPSTADVAAQFGLSVLLVIDAWTMAQTFGALVHGMMTYRPELKFAGVLGNRVAGEAHGAMLAESLRDRALFRGAIPNDPDASLPERHLGLVMPDEVRDLEARLDRAAASQRNFDFDALPELGIGAPPSSALPRSLEGVRIAVARDAASCFMYPANLDLLRAMGAELVFFSPRDDRALPDASALYLPGGYPELHAAELSRNGALHRAIQAHVEQGKPAVAECGGLMMLARGLRTADGRRHDMAGVLDLEVEMKLRLVAIGHYACDLPEGSLRGHSFHHSSATGGAVSLPAAFATSPHGGAPEPVYRVRRLVASYVHWYLPSNPEAAARLFTA
jgi:cobyrinic acid a,c-diamide synthase